MAHTTPTQEPDNPFIEIGQEETVDVMRIFFQNLEPNRSFYGGFPVKARARSVGSLFLICKPHVSQTFKS